MIYLSIVDSTRQSCSHNGDLKDGWWNLEFPEPTPVTKVVIYNREDCCQDRINNVQVKALKICHPNMAGYNYISLPNFKKVLRGDIGNETNYYMTFQHLGA